MNYGERKPFNTFDKTVFELCNEVDFHQAEAEYWKQRFEDLNREYSEFRNETFKSTQRDVGNLFKLAFCLEEDEKGNLLINTENRKFLKGK